MYCICTMKHDQKLKPKIEKVYETCGKKYLAVRKDRKTCSDYCRLVKSAKNRFEKISQITVNEMDCEVAWVIGAFNLNNLFLWGLCIPIGMAPMWAVNVKNNCYTQAYLSLRQFRINDKEYQEAIMVEQKQY